MGAARPPVGGLGKIFPAAASLMAGGGPQTRPRPLASRFRASVSVASSQTFPLGASFAMELSSLPEAAAAIQRAAEADRQDRWQTIRLLAYPVLVGVLAAVGTGWFALSGFPQEGTIISAARPAVADRGIPTVRFWRAFRWPAVLGTAALAVAAAVWWRRVGSRPRPAGRREAVACDVRAAATLAGLPPADQERLVAEACRGGSVAERPLAAFAAAVTDPLERAEALRASGDFYWLLVERRRRRRAWLWPIAGTLAAGLVVLLYGVAMIGPLADFMNTIAIRPPAPRGSLSP